MRNRLCTSSQCTHNALIHFLSGGISMDSTHPLPLVTHTTRAFTRAGFVSILAVLWAVLLFVPAAQAQFRASIQGTVTDPDGAVIPDATLTLKNNETGSLLTATSNAAGVYNFGALPPAHFTL